MIESTCVPCDHRYEDQTRIVEPPKHTTYTQNHRVCKECGNLNATHTQRAMNKTASDVAYRAFRFQNPNLWAH
jgi:ribosomal protein L32